MAQSSRSKRTRLKRRTKTSRPNITARSNVTARRKVAAQQRPAGRAASVIEASRIPLRLVALDEERSSEQRFALRLVDLLRIVVDLRDLVLAPEALLRIFRWHRLDFSMQAQQQTNWCWAAVSTSVALFYDPASTWTQCAVANGELGRNDCCGTGASGPCNVYGFLGSSLNRVGHLASQTGSSSTFATVRAEIDAGRPLGVRTAWSGGGAHFLCIIGYRIYEQMLAVDDPWYGKSDVDYATFSSSYQGSGSWTHSYFTQP